MTRFLALALLAAGCAATPSPAPPDAFDADGWLARARTAQAGPFADDPEQTAAKALSAELDAAVGWAEACDTWWNPDSGQLETDPAPSPGFTRGTFEVHDVAGGAVVAVTCDFGAYQGSYALVHVADGRAALLPGQGVDSDGRLFGPPTAIYSTPAFDGSARFETFAKARGLGDCGILATYEITGPGQTALVQARARDCEGDPEAAGTPDTWPVVYGR